MAGIKRGIVFSCKKGMTHELFFNVFELVLASIVLLALLFFVHGIAKQTIFEKNYLARDLAVLLNAVYAAPGELTYKYNENAAGFTFDFASGKVDVRSESKDPSNIFYPFAKNDRILFQYKTLSYATEPAKIEISKSPESVSVGKQEPSQY